MMNREVEEAAGFLWIGHDRGLKKAGYGCPDKLEMDPREGVPPASNEVSPMPDQHRNLIINTQGPHRGKGSWACPDQKAWKETAERLRRFSDGRPLRRGERDLAEGAACEVVRGQGGQRGGHEAMGNKTVV